MGKLKNKQGYTLIEILLCLAGVTLVIVGSFTLFGKFNLSLVKQTELNNIVYNENIVFKELNDLILNSKTLEINDKSIILNKDSVLYFEDNKIYINNKCLIEEQNIDFEVKNNRIFITIGDDVWCFRRINTET